MSDKIENMPGTYDSPFHGHAMAWQVPGMQDRSSKRSGNANQPAKLIVDIATSQQTDPFLNAEGKNAAAVALGRQGGLKGGEARARKLTPEKRSEIARLAAAARWKRDDR